MILSKYTVNYLLFYVQGGDEKGLDWQGRPHSKLVIATTKNINNELSNPFDFFARPGRLAQGKMNRFHLRSEHFFLHIAFQLLKKDNTNNKDNEDIKTKTNKRQQTKRQQRQSSFIIIHPQ